MPTGVQPQLRAGQGDREPGHGHARPGRRGGHLQRARDGQRARGRRGILRARRRRATVTGEFHPISPVRVCDTRSTSPTPACKAHGILGPGGSDARQRDRDRRPTRSRATGRRQRSWSTSPALPAPRSTYLSLSPTTSTRHSARTAASTLRSSRRSTSRRDWWRRTGSWSQLGPSTPGGHDTSLCVYNAAGSINVLIDANGWFGSATAAAGAQYQAIQPTRICDTRTSAADRAAPGTRSSAIRAR